jgi:hypothetical protein
MFYIAALSSTIFCKIKTLFLCVITAALSLNIFVCRQVLCSVSYPGERTRKFEHVGRILRANLVCLYQHANNQGILLSLNKFITVDYLKNCVGTKTC